MKNTNARLSKWVKRDSHLRLTVKNLYIDFYGYIIYAKVMDPIEAYRNKIGERLTRRLAKALQDEKITKDELSEASSYILDNIDIAKDASQLVDFLSALSQKWPIFSDVLTLEEGEIKEEKEDEAIEKTEALIKESKFDEALKVAESATENRGEN